MGVFNFGVLLYSQRLMFVSHQVLTLCTCCLTSVVYYVEGYFVHREANPLKTLRQVYRGPCIGLRRGGAGSPEPGAPRETGNALVALGAYDRAAPWEHRTTLGAVRVLDRTVLLVDRGTSLVKNKKP